MYHCINAQSDNIVTEYNTVLSGRINGKSLLYTKGENNYFFFSESDMGLHDLTKGHSEFNPYFMFSFNAKDLFFLQTMPYFFSDKLALKEELTKDSASLPNWKTSTETKEILGYKCKKASTNFRGRDWIVWYTTELPNMIFPWKLTGLPGAILEATEGDKLFSFKINNLILNYKNDILEDEIKFFEKNSIEPIDYRLVIENKNKDLIFLREREAASHQNSNSYSNIEELKYSELEKTFEWETSPVKF
ncbi:GLPGLI family protein [Amniculibacterium sp. G2-70]|uniref:GLPGLI family protein n=1 Tax=Amniculibacterium sp. G2-70 TaxID=2767188 RepID=UPI0021CC54BF|nr:GLPGLI family protein [Amniculibacterium sp. G2-70]